MPSVFSHAIAAVAIGGAAVAGPTRLPIWGLGALCAVVPDLDVVSFFFGLPYGHVLGHRGLSHSLLFAAVLASIGTAVARRTLPASPSTPRLWGFFFLATPRTGCSTHDERRPRSRVLRSVLRHPLLPSMATDRGLARYRSAGSSVGVACG